MALIIREATLSDVPVMHNLTVQLALYEKSGRRTYLPQVRMEDATLRIFTRQPGERGLFFTSLKPLREDRERHLSAFLF